MKWDRKYFIREQYGLVAEDPDLGVEVYYGEENGKPVALGFAGKRQKPDFHYNFKDCHRRSEYVQKWYEGLKATAARKAEQKKAKVEYVHDVKVGDVFRCSWGYDQTNIDYYEVVAVRGKLVDIRPIAQQSEGTGWLQGKCVPSPGSYIGDVITKRVQDCAGKPCLTITSFSSAFRETPVEIVPGLKVFSESHWTAYA